VSKDSQQRLGVSAGVAGRAEGRSESSFGLRDGGFDVPAVSVDAPVEPSAHLPPVAAGRPFACVAFIEGDDRRTNAEFFPSQGVVVFPVVPGIGQQAVDRQASDGRSERLRELRRVLTGPRTEQGAGEEITVRVTEKRQLRKRVSRLALVAATPDVVPRRVAAFETGGVDGGFGPRVDQAALTGNTENGIEEGIESPFFSNRSCAYLRVE